MKPCGLYQFHCHHNHHRMRYWLFALLLLGWKMPSAQSFHNLDFATLCDSLPTGLCHWQQSWATKATRCTVDRVNGDPALLIDNGATPGVGFVEQVVTVAPMASPRLFKVSGRVRTENVTGRGAGLNFSALDDNGAYLHTADMGYGDFAWAKGNADWRPIKLNTIIPAGTSSIRLGLLHYGSGKVWLDDLQVQLLTIDDRKAGRAGRRYVQQALGIIGAHSLRRDSVDMKAIRQTALRIAGNQNDPADHHQAVIYALNALGDHHSFLMTPDIAKAWQDSEGEATANINYVKVKQIDRYGYLSVPGFHANSEKLKIAYADSIQTALQRLDQAGVRGWIVDLRGNDGGNMEPMLAGLGPLFDADTLGFLVDVTGGKEAWGYRNDAPFSGDEPGTPASRPIRLQERQLPIAVLFGPRTGSSGEIVVLSFVGNRNTRSFGQPTMGLTTGNGMFDLSDGAKMLLASTVMADRRGRRYYGSVAPDVPVSDSGQAGEDATLEAALEWLNSLGD